MKKESNAEINIWINRIIKYCYFCCVFFVCPIEAEANLSETKEALDTIADFADRICKDIPIEGVGESIELSGNAKLKLNALLKMLADIGVEGTGKYENKEYKGVLQKDLVEVLKKSTECKMEIFDKLRDTLRLSNKTDEKNSTHGFIKPVTKTENDIHSKTNYELGNVKYQISRVIHTGRELQIWIKSYNEGADLETGIYFTSSLTDSDGTSHEQSDRMAGGMRGGMDSLSLTIPHKVPTKFGLAFKSVPPDIKTIPFVNISLNKQGKIQFRNIPVPYKNETTFSPNYITSNLNNKKLRNVKYSVSQVIYTGQELQIWIKAYNEGADLETGIYFTSSLTDSDGTSHEQSDRMAGGRRGGMDSFSLTFPHKVPTKFGLAFKSVSPDIKTIPFINISLNNQGKLQFRNIPVPYKKR